MVKLYEKIGFFLTPLFEAALGKDRSNQNLVVLSALILAAIPLLVGSVVMAVYFLLGESLKINWVFPLSLAVLVGIGLLLVWFKKFTAARYLVVSALFIYSLLLTWQKGFTFPIVLLFVITMLAAYLMINRRQITVPLIILLPALVSRFLSAPETYSEVSVWIYIGMMSTIGLMLGLLNYLNDLAKIKLMQMDELKAVQQAGVSILSSLDLQETTSRILAELKNILPHEYASVFLIAENNQIEMIAGSGWKDSEEVLGVRFPVPENDSLSIVIKDGQPHIHNGVLKDYLPFLEPNLKNIRSLLGFPLVSKNEIIGMLALASEQRGYFSSEHIRLVSAFADHVAIAIENARLFDLATEAINRRAILYRASQEVIRAGADLEKIYLTIHSSACELMPCEAFVISLLDETEQYIDGAYLIDRGGRSEHIRIPLGEGMAGTIIDTGQTILETDLLKRPDFKGEHFGHQDSVRSLVAVPFSIGNKVIGMLSAQSYQPDDFGQEEVELLQLLAAQAGVAIENARLLARMEHMANTDGLTGLKNRRAFDNALASEITRAQRYAYPLSLMVMDIDDFKQFNDQYGHSRGDQHLIHIADLISHAVRDPDIVARIGGEEFSVILPHTSREGALELAERVRSNIENAYLGQYRVGGTISIGVAEYPRDGQNPLALFDTADRVMFQIKRSGKNRVGSPIDKEHA